MFKKHNLKYSGQSLKLFLSIVATLLLTSFMVVNTTQAKTTSSAGSIGTWSLVSSPVSNNLKSISMTSVNNGWIVGEGGIILHWDGNIWSTANSPTANTLYFVKMISENDGWAVGALGTILHWDGFSWNLMNSPTSTDLFSVGFVSPTKGWAVGSIRTGTYYLGVILKWDGTVWNVGISNEINRRFKTVAAIADDDVWVVGRYEEIMTPSNPNPLIRTGVYHWDGQAWYEHIVNNCDNWINSTVVSSDNTGWAVGTYGCILPFNAGLDGASSVPGIPSNTNFVSTARVAADDVWVVGGDSMTESFSKSLIMHWNGITWDVILNPGGRMLTGVSMISANNGWAVGYGGTILHYSNYQYVYLPLQMH